MEYLLLEDGVTWKENEDCVYIKEWNSNETKDCNT